MTHIRFVSSKLVSSKIVVRFTAYCLLPTAYRPLPTADELVLNFTESTEEFLNG